MVKDSEHDVIRCSGDKGDDMNLYSEEESHHGACWGGLFHNEDS